MGFALKRSVRPKVTQLRNNFLRGTVLLAFVTLASVYGIAWFTREISRLEGFEWLLVLLISVWVFVGALWFYSLLAYRKAVRKFRVSSSSGFRSRKLSPSGSSFNRSAISGIKMRSS